MVASPTIGPEPLTGRIRFDFSSNERFQVFISIVFDDLQYKVSCLASFRLYKHKDLPLAVRGRLPLTFRLRLSLAPPSSSKECFIHFDVSSKSEVFVPMGHGK